VENLEKTCLSRPTSGATAEQLNLKPIMNIMVPFTINNFYSMTNLSLKYTSRKILGSER